MTFAASAARERVDDLGHRPRDPAFSRAMAAHIASCTSPSNPPGIGTSVSGRPPGNVRPQCRLEPGPLADVAGWAEQYRPIWEERFDRLGEYLQQIQPSSEGTDP